MARFSGVAAGTVPASTNALVATPFFWWMREGGRVKSWDGGDSLEIPIMYDENPYARAYRPYEVMDVGPPQGITVATYTLARYRIPLMYDAMTAQSNAGDSQVVNLVCRAHDSRRLQVKLNSLRNSANGLCVSNQCYRWYQKEHLLLVGKSV